MTIRDTGLEDLWQRSSELALAAESLAALFEEGAIRLSRKDQVARLKALRSGILERLERAKGRETAAGTGHSLASTVDSLFRLGAGLITMTQENATMQAISRQLLARPTGNEPTFGTVLICVGPGGIPEHVDVVSISRVARESKRDEREVMDTLRAGGNLLFTAEAFSYLIDTLSDGILKGVLILPVSSEKVSQIQGPSLLLLSRKKKG